MWITNGPVADVAVVWAQAEASEEEPAGVRGFGVPTGHGTGSPPRDHAQDRT